MNVCPVWSGLVKADASNALQQSIVSVLFEVWQLLRQPHGHVELWHVQWVQLLGLQELLISQLGWPAGLVAMAHIVTSVAKWS